MGRKLKKMRSVNKRVNYNEGNPKTLTPSPRTPTMDQVRRVPMDRSMDYLYGPPLRTTPQNRIKIINKYFSYGLSNRLLVTAKFRTLHCVNVTDLDSGSGAISIITHCHFLCCGKVFGGQCFWVTLIMIVFQLILYHAKNLFPKNVKK